VVAYTGLDSNATLLNGTSSLRLEMINTTFLETDSKRVTSEWRVDLGKCDGIDAFAKLGCILQFAINTPVAIPDAQGRTSLLVATFLYAKINGTGNDSTMAFRAGIVALDPWTGDVKWEADSSDFVDEPLRWSTIFLSAPSVPKSSVIGDNNVTIPIAVSLVRSANSTNNPSPQVSKVLFLSHVDGSVIGQTSAVPRDGVPLPSTGLTCGYSSRPMVSRPEPVNVNGRDIYVVQDQCGNTFATDQTPPSNGTFLPLWIQQGFTGVAAPPLSQMLTAGFYPSPGLLTVPAASSTESTLRGAQTSGTSLALFTLANSATIKPDVDSLWGIVVEVPQANVQHTPPELPNDLVERLRSTEFVPVLSPVPTDEDDAWGTRSSDSVASLPHHRQLSKKQVRDVLEDASRRLGSLELATGRTGLLKGDEAWSLVSEALSQAISAAGISTDFLQNIPVQQIVRNDAHCSDLRRLSLSAVLIDPALFVLKNTKSTSYIIAAAANLDAPRACRMQLQPGASDFEECVACAATPGCGYCLSLIHI